METFFLNFPRCLLKAALKKKKKKDLALPRSLSKLILPHAMDETAFVSEEEVDGEAGMETSGKITFPMIRFSTLKDGTLALQSIRV